MADQSVDYGNWVPKKMLIVSSAHTTLRCSNVLTASLGRSGSSRHLRTLETDWGPMDLDVGRKLRLR